MKIFARFLLVGGCLVLAGCSQISALAPVGGDDVAMVRFATIDLLLDAGIEVLDAPVCELVEKAITCSGETLDGSHISAVSSTSDDATITVTVGEETIHSGSLSDVIDKFARGEE